MENTGITQSQVEQIIASLEKMEEHLAAIMLSQSTAPIGAEHIDLLREINHTVGNIERNQN